MMNTNKIAVFPGSFDPFTKGHEEVINMALPLFDTIYIAVGVNSAKQYLFPLERRLLWTQEIFKDIKKIKVMQYQGLTVDFCQSVHASYIIRGVRNVLDFQAEKDIAEANYRLFPAVNTLFFPSSSQFSHISSSIVRDLFIHDGDYSDYVSVNLY